MNKANPIIRNKFTADPHAIVVDDTVYIFTGEDILPPDAPSNEYFRMPHWLLFSSKDMKTFKEEGVVLKPSDFVFGKENTAWACDVAAYTRILRLRDGRKYTRPLVKRQTPDKQSAFPQQRIQLHHTSFGN